jgi:hypothetical protein
LVIAALPRLDTRNFHQDQSQMRNCCPGVRMQKACNVIKHDGYGLIVRRGWPALFQLELDEFMSVIPVFFTARVCPASCQMKSPSYGAMPRSADPSTISASTPPRT